GDALFIGNLESFNLFLFPIIPGSRQSYCIHRITRIFCHHHKAALPCEITDLPPKMKPAKCTVTSIISLEPGTTIPPPSLVLMLSESGGNMVLAIHYIGFTFIIQRNYRIDYQTPTIVELQSVNVNHFNQAAWAAGTYIKEKPGLRQAAAGALMARVVLKNCQTWVVEAVEQLFQAGIVSASSLNLKQVFGFLGFVPVTHMRPRIVSDFFCFLSDS
ncbi:hypothetical protein QBC38DRAFT_517069, partial [Podospora fimiseda]